ncbi:MAG: hypothetical protein WDZ51_14960 [Pirellulaceae bacterium]
MNAARTTDHTVHTSNVEPHLGTWASRVRRVSWGAILAGFVAAASLQLLLSILGLAVGLWSINPTTEANPVAGLATGTGIFWVVTSIITMFIGGCVAAYMCGVPDRIDGALHGMVIWGVMTLVSFWYVGSTFGTVFSATTSALGSGVAAVGEMGQMAIPDGTSTTNQGQMRQPTQQESQQVVVNYEQMGDQLANLLEDTGKEDLSPEQLQGSRERLMKISQEAAQTALMRPGQADQEVDRVVGAFFEEWQQVEDDLDQDAAVNVLSSNSELSEEEARRTIERWENQYGEARQELNQQLAQLEQQVTEQYREVKKVTLETTEEAAHTVGNIAMWSFFSLLLGLVAASGGGFLATTMRPDTYDAA